MHMKLLEVVGNQGCLGRGLPQLFCLKNTSSVIGVWQVDLKKITGNEEE